MVRTLVLAFLVAPSSGAQLAELGRPLVRAFTPEQYEGDLQVFDVAQGPDGVLRLACPGDFAVLCFDGERWRKTEVGLSVLSVDVDDEGCTWLGSSGAFGYLRESLHGAEFVFLSAEALASAGAPPNFIGTFCTPRGVFFLSAELLVRWDGQQASTWHATEDGGFMDLVVLGADVFVLDGARGLLVVAGDELLESEALGEERVLFHGLGSDGERLVGVWLDEEGLSWVDSLDARRSTLQIAELEKGPNYVSDVVLTPNGGLVVATGIGIVLIDPSGAFQAWLDERSGLPSSLVYSLHLDREGVVWAGLSYGLARIDPAPSASFFGPELGLEGTPLALVRHQDRLYCGTLRGLFRLGEQAGRARFERVPSLPAMPIFELHSMEHGLLMGTELGLFVLGAERGRVLAQEQPLAFATLVKGQPFEEEAVLVANFETLTILRWQAGEGWRFEAPLPVFWTTAALEADEGGFWLHSSERELVWLPFGGVFGEPLVMPGKWLGVSPSRHGLLAWGQEGPALFRDSTSPEPLPSAGVDWTQFHAPGPWSRPIVDPGGRFWWLDRRTLRRLSGDLEQGLGGEPDLVWTSPIALEGLSFDESRDDVIWLRTHAGLVRLEKDGLRSPYRSTPLVRALARILDEAWSPFEPGTRLPPHANLRFEVAAAQFAGSATEYRYRLEGLESAWSSWAALSLKEYTSLPGRDYVLHVEARSGGDTLGAHRLDFAVASPWYSTWPFRTGLALLVGAAGLAFQGWRSRRMRRENERLGRLVAERTHDLQAQKKRVAEHADELENVNARLLGEITAREVAEHTRREMHERLEVAERFESLGAVAGGIAHDFNNYLTSIQGYAELAREECGGQGKLSEYLAHVTTVSGQAAELCSGLVSLVGRVPLSITPIDLSSLVQGMAALLRTSIQDRGELRLELADDLAAVLADPSQVRRAVVNLALNAAEASAGGTGPITIRTGSRTFTTIELQHMHRAGEREAGPYTYVEVEDQGIGLAPEAVHRIFDPFYSTKFVGRGLGLAAVFHILASHRGAIDVRSEVGRGTCIRLLFPESTVVPAPFPGALQRAPAARLSGRVLVVDDDKQVRELTEAFCQRLGLEVLAASDGQSALELLAVPPRIDALLLDLSMPGMDGLEVLNEVRRVRPDLPVLILSGYSNHVPYQVLDGSTFFLGKPFSLDGLARMLEGVLLHGAESAAPGVRG